MERYIASYAHGAASQGSRMENQMASFLAAKEEDALKHVSLRNLDPDTDYKVQRVASKINESFQLVVNEPSVGLYRIQEHINRTLPNLDRRRNEISESGRKAEKTSLDLDYALSSVKEISSIRQLTNVREALKNSIEMMNGIVKMEAEARAEREKLTRVARKANRSLSQNAPAEGYICPVCYFALATQTDLISHWSAEHNLESYENDVFQNIEMPDGKEDGTVDEATDVTRTVSEGQDVVLDHSDNDDDVQFEASTPAEIISLPTAVPQDRDDTYGIENSSNDDDVNDMQSI